MTKQEVLDKLVEFDEKIKDKNYVENSIGINQSLKNDSVYMSGYGDGMDRALTVGKYFVCQMVDGEWHKYPDEKPNVEWGQYDVVVKSKFGSIFYHYCEWDVDKWFPVFDFYEDEDKIIAFREIPKYKGIK